MTHELNKIYQLPNGMLVKRIEVDLEAGEATCKNCPFHPKVMMCKMSCGYMGDVKIKCANYQNGMRVAYRLCKESGEIMTLAEAEEYFKK